MCEHRRGKVWLEPAAPRHMNQQNLADFIWNVADTLRGPFKPSLYGRIILPFTVLRRLECVLEPTRDAVRARHAALAGTQGCSLRAINIAFW